MNPNAINVALLGNVTTEYIGNAICSESKKYNIEAKVYNAPFKQYNQDILDIESSFYRFKPELTILFLEGWELFPNWYDTLVLMSDNAVKEDMIKQVADAVEHYIEAIHNVSDTRIIINNFRMPYHSPLGIVDSRLSPGLKKMITLLNLSLEEYISALDYAYFFDYNGFCSYYGQCYARDEKMYYLAGSTLSFTTIKQLAKEYMRYILPLKSKNKKCLVLDLDNTLWGGIAGEDGLAGIKLDITGEGLSFYNFQKEILNLYHKGILLAVNSKNNAEDALEIIETHPYMLLRKKYFSCLKINWQDKAANLREISNELNIGLDSTIFFDDSQFEREFINSSLPEVTVVDVPQDSSKYCRALNNIVEFETLNITNEDRDRNEMYQQNIERFQAMQMCQDKDEYLSSLQTCISVVKANQYNIQRIAQLTQKTNQFNMTTKRYQAANIQKMIDNGNHSAYCCSVSDKFGDSGITGCCIIKLDGAAAYIDSFLLSCRVLGRNAEYAFISAIARILRHKGIKTVYSEYQATEKNKANRDFYIQAGFSNHYSDNEKTVFILEEKDEIEELKYIEVNIEEEK